MDTYFDTCELKKATELEHAEYLATAGADTAEILELFPHYDIEIIDKIIERVAWFCFISPEEVDMLIRAKPLTLREWVFKPDGEPLNKVIRDCFMDFYLLSASQGVPKIEIEDSLGDMGSDIDYIDTL